MKKPAIVLICLGAAGLFWSQRMLSHETLTTTVLFDQDECIVAPSGELIIKVRGA